MDVRIGCNETINAISVADIPLDSAKKTPPKYNPWNNMPLMDAFLKAFKEMYLFFEKKMKKRKNKKATIPNLIESERKGEAFGQSQDNYIAIPITNFLKKFSNKWTSLSINIEAPSESEYEKTRQEAIGIMRSIRKVEPGEENDFEIVTSDEMIETLSGFTSGIKVFALLVSVIALVVAGIGIMNIMLVSVTERIKEIGIRKAIGATKQDILTQFLMEAVFLSEFGGIVGIVFGVGAGNIVSFIFNIPAVVPIDWAIIGLVVCSVIGIGFGIYPAWKAAQLDPIESLRFE